MLSCSKTESIDKDKLVDVYANILIIRESESDSLLAIERIDSVLGSYGMTEMEFRQTIFQLSRTDKEFIKIIDSTRNRIRSIKKEESISR